MLQARIDAIKENAALMTQNEAHQKAALAYAALARTALNEGAFEQGWRNVVGGETTILGTRPDEEVSAKARAIAVEVSGGLPPSEAEAILAVLPDVKSGIPQTPDWRCAVVEAYTLYQRRVVERMDARERTGTRIAILAVALTLLLTCILVLVWADPKALQVSAAGSPRLSPILMIAASIMGGIGACLSGLLSLAVLGQVPSQYEGISVTVAKPLVGLASGFVAALLLDSGLIVFRSGSTAAIVGFVFGFSERLIIGTAQRFEVAQTKG